MDTQADQPKVTFEVALKRKRETGKEFCVSCLTSLNFPALLHIGHPARHEGGARYVEGGGQLCSTCGPINSDIPGYAEH